LISRKVICREEKRRKNEGWIYTPVQRAKRPSLTFMRLSHNLSAEHGGALLNLAGLDEKLAGRRGKIVVSQAVHFSKQTEPHTSLSRSYFEKARNTWDDVVLLSIFAAGGEEKVYVQ
jgi:hypothetical protein